MSDRSDLIDAACEREQQLRMDAIEEQSRRAHLGDPAQWEKLSAKWCAGCGARIPDARRKAVPGVQLCKECQEDAELMSRQGRRLMQRFGQQGED